MFGHGYGGSYPPDGSHHHHNHQQSAMPPGRYEDPPPHPQHHPCQHDSSRFHRQNAYYPPEQRHDSHYPPGPPPPFWPHDVPRYDAPPPAYPPQVPSFYRPQHEFVYPPESGFYPPHVGVPHNSSFGVLTPPPTIQQHARTHSYALSYEEHRNSTEFLHVSSFGQQGRPPLADGYAHESPLPHHTPSFHQHTLSVQAGKPSNLERESVTTTEIPAYVNPLPANVELPKGQLVRVFCKSNRSFNLSVKDNRPLMVLGDTEDESQQWIRDDKYSIRVRDSYGHPAFMLINKESKKALKHGYGKLQEVQLMVYNPELQDDDLFWTESQDFGEGFKTIRPANDTLLNLSVKSIGNNVENGAPLVLDTWHKKDLQMWKIFPL